MKSERVSRDQALERIRHHIRENPPGTQEIPTAEAIGRVCAQDILAPRNVPAEAMSSVDGYALSSAETKGAAEHDPALFALSAQIRPSTPEPESIGPGQAAPILTGGRLPKGADCVLPSEDVEALGPSLLVPREARKHEHVRAPGSDLRLKSRIVRGGEELTPTVLAALAVSGVARLRAFNSPEILALAIGNELAPLDEPPGPGRLPADNLLLVAGLLRMRGAANVRAEVCPNDPERIAARLRESQQPLVITTGGTGPGERDFIRKAAELAGFTPLFGGLALTPGKSCFAAVRAGRLLMALPGTPWAVFTLMHALILPAVCWLRGRTLPAPVPILARPSAPLPLAQVGWERLIPCVISAIGAELQAKPLLDKQRETRLDMLQAQGLLLVSDKMEPGELLPMIPIWEGRRGQRLG